MADTKNYYTLLQNAETTGRQNIALLNNSLSELSEELQFFNQDEKCYFNYLSLYVTAYKGDYPNSIDNLNQYLDSCPDHRSQLRGKKHMANLQVIAGDYEDAIINLNDAIDLSANVNDSFLLPQVYTVASIVYRLIHQDELSLKYAELLINGKYTNDYKCYGGSFKFRLLLRQNKVFDDTEMSEYISLCEEVGLTLVSLFLQLDWYRYVVVNYDDKNLIATELNNLIKLSKDIDGTQFKNIKVYYHAVLSQMYLKSGQPKQAKAIAKKVISENVSIGESEQLLLALQVLIDLNLNENIEIDAYRYLHQKSSVEKKLYEANMAKQVAFFRVKHNTLAQELEIERLNQSNQVLELEKKLAVETSKKQWYLVALVLTGLVLLGLWTYRIKRRHDYFRSVSEVDHLTKVFTRKAFEEQLAKLVKESKITLKPINLAILDLDHFKEVNDKFGHLVGDWVLQNVIIACEDVIDQDTLIARLGGEEFAIVTPNISMQKTKLLLEKMRVAIEKLDCSPSGHNFNVTASFGVTTSLISGLEQAILLTHADVALFEAKNNGRNQIVEFKGD